MTVEKRRRSLLRQIAVRNEKITELTAEREALRAELAQITQGKAS